MSQADVGDNPDRIATSAAFAMLCGVAPIPATSGKTANRHRLNRGGDRHANAALYRIAVCRLRHDERTRTYRDQICSRGKTTTEAMRILKRAIAREIHQAIKTDLTTTPTRLDIHRSIPIAGDIPCSRTERRTPRPVESKRISSHAATNLFYGGGGTSDWGGRPTWH